MVSYAYNGDGSVRQKTKAKGQRVTWTTNGNGQPVDVGKFTGASAIIEAECAKVTYKYDSQLVDTGFVRTNLQGRVAAVSTGCNLS